MKDLQTQLDEMTKEQLDKTAGFVSEILADYHEQSSKIKKMFGENTKMTEQQMWDYFKSKVKETRGLI